MMYVTVYIMSFNSNCRILAAELNYRFTFFSVNQMEKFKIQWNFIQEAEAKKYSDIRLSNEKWKVKK